MERRGRSRCILLVLLLASNVHISAKRFMVFNEEPSDIVALRNQPAELRCNVSGDANIKISWKKDGVTLDLTKDPRRTIQGNGSLTFLTIIRQKRNSPDEGDYQCVATTKVQGGTFTMVSKKATLTVVGMSKSFSERPSNVTVSEGETAIFKCQLKRSRPPAKITWSIAGKNTDLMLNFRFVVLPSGTLEIRSVMGSDAGVYVCKATNEKTGKSVRTTASLSVKPGSTNPKATKFLVKPQDVVILHKKDLILECIFTGYPAPQVTWYKDGQKISLTSGRYAQYGTNNLNISSVQVGDSGKYVCDGGAIKAEANVQVIVPPRFVNPPHDTTTVEDENIKMTCDVTGSPTPQVSWYYNGGPVGILDYLTVTNNTLSLMEALNQDEGMYQCFAKNSAGEVQASAQLIVIADEDLLTTPSSTTTLPPTTLPPTTTIPSTTPRTTPIITTTKKRPNPSAPRNVAAYALSTSSIAVSWKPPAQPHGTITSYTLVANNVVTDKATMVSTTKTLLTVDNLTPDTSYEFVVYATNQNGRPGALSKHAVTRTKSIPTVKPSIKVMGPPRGVKVEAISSIALRVTWKEPVYIPVPIQNYTIEYEDIDRNTQPQSTSTMTLQVVLLKLLPYTQYSIKVTAFNMRGAGESSKGVVGRTKSGIPKGPPENVEFKLMKDVLVAHWDEPSVPNGNITGYMVDFKNEVTGKITTSTITEMNRIFKNVEKSTTYSFRVAAVTEAGHGEFSSWRKAATAFKPLTELVVPGKPTNLNVRVLQGMIQVKWGPPAEKHIIVRGYILNYGKGAPGHNYEYLNNNVTSFLLQNLQAGSIYVILVRAKNKNGEGPIVFAKAVIPDDVHKPSNPLYNLQALPTKKKALKLSWRDQLTTLQPYVTYNIKYEKDNEWITMNTSRKTILVKHLTPGMRYKFFIKRDNQDNYVTVANFTREEVPSTPKDLRVALVAENLFVSLHWNSPDDPNGKLLNYRICCKALAAQNWTCTLIKGNTLNYRMSDIEANVTYVVRISAINSAGAGEFSEIKEFDRGTTGHNIRAQTTETVVKNKAQVPSTPKDLRVALVAENLFVSLHWNSPDDPNGKLLNYRICCKALAAQNWTCTLIKGNTLNYRMSDIEANVTYVVRISAINSAGAGEFSEIKEFDRGTTGHNIRAQTTETVVKNKAQAAKNTGKLTSDEKILWIVIAVIAAITLVAIVAISAILCKKRAGGSPLSRRKPPADPYKAVANGSVKKKGSKENYWIKQNTMELEPLDKKGKGQDPTVAPIIPRNADEMKPLDSPFHSRKDPLLEESDHESFPQMKHDRVSPSSFNDTSLDLQDKNEDPYLPLPAVAPKPKSINIYKSPFLKQSDDFPPLPKEALDNTDDDGPPTSSDYGSEEIVAPTSTPEHPPVSYLPKRCSNGYVSVASDYEYPPKDNASQMFEASALQNLIKDLDAIVAKEDRV